MRIRIAAVALAASLGMAAVPLARAADLPVLATDPAVPASPAWYSNVYVHLGATAVILDTGAKIDMQGVGRLPGATIKSSPQYTATVEAGYYLSPNWAVSATVGVPPTAQIYGSGTVAALGKFGSTVYGPVALTGHYHFTNFGRFQPYIGLGPTYMIAFDSRDGAVTGLQVRSAWGALAQVGFDEMLTDHIGVFVDYKKAYLRTDAVGVVLGAPITAKVKLDPSVVTAGLTYRF